MNTFEQELTKLINIYSKENNSNTPDFILAEYIKGCLDNFDRATKQRDDYYGLGFSNMKIKIF